MSTSGKEANIEQDIYRMLTKAFLLLDDSDHQLFAAHGLTTRQYWALQHLDEERGSSMIDLSRVLLTDKSNVTSIVDRLENLKLVKRATDQRDRRVILVTLTLEGRHLRDILQEQHNALIRDLFGVLQPSHLQTLLEDLQSINQRIEAHLEQGQTSPVV